MKKNQYAKLVKRLANRLNKKDFATIVALIRAYEGDNSEPEFMEALDARFVKHYPKLSKEFAEAEKAGKGYPI
jgi:enoyl reductase-like protein